MAMISDVDYMLHAIRLSSLRITDDPLTPRIISLDPAFAINPYITASGLSDVDRWPEIKRALDSPPLEEGYLSGSQPGSRAGGNGDADARRARAGGTGGGGLNYTQTIMGPGRTGGAGMRVSGRHAQPGESTRRGQALRANSSNSVTGVAPLSPGSMGAVADRTPRGYPTDAAGEGDMFSPSGRPRADSAPIPGGLPTSPRLVAASPLNGRGAGMDASGGLLQRALSSSQMSSGSHLLENTGMVATPEERGSSAGLGATGTQTVEGRMTGALVDEGSDVDEEEAAEAEGRGEGREASAVPDSRRVSVDTMSDAGHLDFTPVVPQAAPGPRPSALTAALNKHVPHLVSTSGPSDGQSPPPVPSASTNPFYGLYSAISAPPPAPSVSLELYFPHSKNPTVPIVGKVRKDATVEEVTGFGLWRYWEEGRVPKLEDDSEEAKWSTVGWGLRIVEDDGEVDEDFPPLDRESQISKFSYGQFAIVEASEAQIRQNAAKAPTIQRRPSRVLAVPITSRPPPMPNPPSRANLAPPPANQGGGSTSSSFSSSEFIPLSTTATPGQLSSTAMKGSVGLSSTSSQVVRLKVRVNASADVHFTTTINVPADMYIADLVEVLCKKKRLQMPATDWVLCLADFSLALPLDRTVASMEGRCDLALVKRVWAVEHGLRVDDRRGGDPSASIFKRQSEPAPIQRFGPHLNDFSQTYKKFTVQRKIAIGRHERVLAIDGDYIHIMPSESRAFFDSMKTTSFHISLVAACKLTGRAGGFKINVWRDGAQKRYEFEAENQRQAVEIVSTIRQLMKTYSAERGSVPSALPAARSLPRR
ncbi:hypothetical protein IAT38_005295 [Cryptococcus sp. DSM 104549]